MDEEVEQTSSFSGLVSVFMPSNSWVAKWNNFQGKLPCIYAVNILDEASDLEGQGNDTLPKKKRTYKPDAMYSDDEDGYYDER